MGEQLLFDDEALFHFLHVFGGRQFFRFDLAADQELADLAVVFDELARDLCFGVEVVALDAEVGNLVGEILGFDRDRGEEVGQCAAFGSLQAALHLAGGEAAEEGLVAFGADAAEAAFVFNVFVNQAAEDFFGLRELATGVDTLLIGQAAFDDFLPTGLQREVGLGERDGFFRRARILGDEIAGVAGKGVVANVGGWFGEFVDLVDWEEVVFDVVRGPLASDDRLLDYLFEVRPANVAEDFLQVAGEPKLGARGGLFVNELLERGVQLGDELALHGTGSGCRADERHASPSGNFILGLHCGKCLYSWFL